MKKTIKACAALVMAGSFAFAASASAFSDIQNDDSAKIAQTLQDKGIMKGIGKDLFAPSLDLTNAQAIQLIVNAFDLKVNPGVDYMPEASFNNNAWYAPAYEAALHNKIETVTKKDSVNAKMTREAFASLLLEGINTTGQYPTTKMYIFFDDEKEFTGDHFGAIQILGNMRIISPGGEFRPQEPITRMEAAEMVYNAVEFVEKMKSNTGGEETEETDVTVMTAQENDGRVKATLKVSLPNPGYGLKIEDVKYAGNKATVHYTITKPDPNMMYPQVITEAEASTYLTGTPSEVVAELVGGEAPSSDAKLLK
ncbi:S-layer homology domain-containing protein [Saccharibacillus sp. JS10]|uniref:S-layer homology domain-containing protein n=1 Tax=Saccharibacillus sp. JS10 TaxID=2950552 RepID=UPI002108DC0F|nr:S-layer homology domain-containing protein [Saccharibacillus sp. JS10]MCQ4087275.1 S-layer homology domain-containing protein [Saccharibacillus sp. JS10]